VYVIHVVIDTCLVLHMVNGLLNDFIASNFKWLLRVILIF